MGGGMNTYTNRNLYFSSYLIAVGEHLMSYHKVNGNTTLEFESAEKLNDGHNSID